jgi:hypothetical protein
VHTEGVGLRFSSDISIYLKSMELGAAQAPSSISAGNAYGFAWVRVSAYWARARLKKDNNP